MESDYSFSSLSEIERMRERERDNIGEYSAKKIIFSTVGEKVSLYLSLSVVQIFTIMGTIFQDLQFFRKKIGKM